MPSLQGRYWIATVPQYMFTPYLPNGMAYIKGQLEIGEGGFVHWQLLLYFNDKKTKSFVREMMGDGVGTFYELTRNEKGSEGYVWKDETQVVGTRFEMGTRPMRMNSKVDWGVICEQAVVGNLESIRSENPGVYVRCYGSLKRIKLDHSKPKARNNVRIEVYYGVSGAGKSHKAWEELGMDNTYLKIPTTKWWDGYQGEKNVLVDEFRGQVSISLLLTWLDPAGKPLRLETKGGGCNAEFERVILTTNKHPSEWYPEEDEMTKAALMRRLNIIEFNTIYNT